MPTLFQFGRQAAVTYGRLRKNERLRCPIAERQGQVAIVQQP